jgi:hypothetical protein
LTHRGPLQKPGWSETQSGAIVAPRLLPCNTFALPNARWIDPNKDACHTRKSQKKLTAEEIPMSQRALPLRHPHIALGQTPGAREQLKARTLFRAFVDHSLRLMRSLGEFFAAGGALS